MKDINEVLKKNIVQDLILRVCSENFEIVSRKNSYAIRNRDEGDRDVYRVIILPPKGFTANEINQTNSHDEAEHATIEIKGAVRPTSNGFSILKNCLMVPSFFERGEVSSLNQPYLTFSLREENSFGFSCEFHSAGEPPFAVVKSNGFGFYHNLINTTDDWLVLQLYKRLRPQRKINMNPYTESIPQEHSSSLLALHEGIVLYGDDIFKIAPRLVDAVLNIPLTNSLPALAEMLYTHDTGKHEACTAFAVILKLGKTHPDQVLHFLQDALENKKILPYYARQLTEKISRQKQAISEVS